MQKRHQNQQGGSRGGGGSYNRDQRRDSRGGYAPPRPPKESRGDNEKIMYGIVINFKEVFGFLQPFLSVPGEEHLYFNSKDVHGERLQEGDEVQFCLRSGPRGYVAARVSRLETGMKVKKSKVRGLVEKEADQYKFLPGIISIENTLGFDVDGSETKKSSESQLVPFMPPDINKKTRKIMKGDEVEFDLYVIPNSSYGRAHEIILLRSRNDRLIAEQIKELEAQGVAREQGVIETIKNDFGFIRPVDREDQIFFRLEDVLDSKEHLPNEGDEVHFFVITESVKGRVCDRAVHLKYLPHGTVQFEETLGTAIRAVVTVEPRVYPREEPGELILLEEIKAVETSSTATVDKVELWSRCLPEGLTQLKCGDELLIDVTKYRPEKLIFARNVKVSKYRALGRVYGSICDIKTVGGYGFIRSVQGDPDSYFRVAEVLNRDGCLVPENDVECGMLVSYEIIAETARGGVTKLRAIRVLLCSEENFFPRKIVLQKNVHGTIIREGKKGDRDGVGTLKLTEELTDFSGVKCHDVFLSHQDLFCALQDFRDNKYLQEVTIGHFMPYQRYALHTLLRHYFAGIAHETVENKSRKSNIVSDDSESVQVLSLTESNLNAIAKTAGQETDSLGFTSNVTDIFASKENRNNRNGDDEKNRRQDVRIWKIEDPSEFEEWSTLNNTKYESSNHWDNGKINNNEKVISFQRNDVLDSLGGSSFAARPGSDVTCDVCIDRVTGGRVAANIRLSDLQAEDGKWPQLGVLEYLRTAVDGEEHGGFIRCVPSDEKLMWNQPVNSEGEDSAKDWNTGSAVAFEVRVRGGVRYASGVTVLSSESELVPKEDKVLEGPVSGVIISAPLGLKNSSECHYVYLVDVSRLPDLKNKLVDLPSAIKLVKSKKSDKNSDKSSWERKQIPSEKEDEDQKEQNEHDDQKDITEIVPQSSKKEKEKHVASKHFYPALSSIIIPIRQNSSSSIQLIPGTLVQCHIVVNWFKQRQPLYAIDVCTLSTELMTSNGNNKEATTSLASMLRSTENSRAEGMVKGTIIRLKIHSSLGFDITEIALNEEYRKSSQDVANSRGDFFADSSCDTQDGHYYYCDYRELRGRSDNRDKSGVVGAHVGDLVEFIPVEQYKVAACPVISKSRLPQGVVVPSSARRQVVNSSLQESGSSGVKSITMAEGPVGDSIGFIPGWREPFDVKSLPWGHLLSHLELETGNMEKTEST